MSAPFDSRRLMRKLRPWLHRRVSTVNTFVRFGESSFQVVGSGFYYREGDLAVFVTCAHVLGAAFRAASISAEFELVLMDGRNNGGLFNPVAMARFKPMELREPPDELYGGRDMGILILDKRDVPLIATSRRFLTVNDVSKSPIKKETLCAYRGYPSGLYEWNSDKQRAKGWYELTVGSQERMFGLRLEALVDSQLRHGLALGLFGVSGCPVFEMKERKLVGLITRGQAPSRYRKSVDLIAHDSGKVLEGIQKLAACYSGQSDSSVEQVHWEK